MSIPKIDGWGAGLVVFSLICFALPASARGPSSSASYEQVRELGPVGYWPIDEGRGDVVHDRSGNDNHGTIYAVPWQDGFLNFENNIYQWIEIDHHPRYASPTFSMGGWVYSRKEYNEKHFGVLIIGQPFTTAPFPTYKNDGALAWAIWGDEKPPGAMLRFGSPPGDSPGPSLIEVTSAGQGDAIGSVAEQVELATAEWQHVLYTYDQSGTGRLYRNGKLVHAADDVPYNGVDTPFAIGGGRWSVWSQGGTLSLDGSVRHMVLFNRALNSEEVKRLYMKTRPENEPPSLESSGENQPSSPDKVEELIAQVRNRERPEADRAEAALALADKGQDASDAVPVLGNILVNITERKGTHVPRIEDLLRNAVMRALLDIAPEKENVRDLLGKTLAKPLLYTLDGSTSYLADIRPIVREGRYMDALEKLRAHLKTVPRLPKLSGWGADHTDEHLDKLRDRLPLRQEYFDAYLNRGFVFSDANYNAYNQVAIYNGTAYIPVLERVSWNEVKKQYENHLQNLAENKPDPDKKWARLKMLKIGPAGNEQEEYLGGPWLIFDISDVKLEGWGIAMDRNGYIHLTGGQHNHPRRSQWLPGSWKKSGIVSKEKKSVEVMYWVSKEPGNIGSFEFVGTKSHPRSFGGWMNYMQFARSPNGTLFLFGRGNAWSWALQRYNAEKRRWTTISGSAKKMMDRARRKNAEWYENLGGKVPYYGPKNGLVSAYQPAGYNFNRAWSSKVSYIGGIEFDPTGRMHVEMPIYGVGKGGKMTSGPVYAYSDDLGETFYRADGKRLKLPLTVNPIPGHDANMDHHSTRQWYELWMSLIQEAGWNRKGAFDRYK